jgi:ribosomal-protein-alanine N-acetyltransferase
MALTKKFSEPIAVARPANTAEISVRQATRADRFAICRLECACFNWERLFFGLWWRVGKADTQTWVAEIAGGDKARIAGYLIAYAKQLGEQTLPYIGGIGVAPAFRKQGIGEQLMQPVMQREQKIWLHVRSHNQAAIRLYERLGFDQLRTLPRFYGNGEDAFIMVRL